MTSVDIPSGSDDYSGDSAPHKGRKSRNRKPELRVVFDTNAIFTGSESELVRHEVSSLIREAQYQDLAILWYLPEIVRHERQFQMQKRALELRGSLEKIEKLLGHNLAITSELLVRRVEECVKRRQADLGLLTLKLDCTSVDWERILVDSAFRKVPFQDGEAEKGFRDAVVVESFVQLVAASPKTPKACRLVLVSGDKRVNTAVLERISGASNVKVIPSLEELKGYINTLVSEVTEEYIASLTESARNIFFIPEDNSTLYYAANVRSLITDIRKTAETELPPGAETKKTTKWLINWPTFSGKKGRTVHWSTRVELNLEAYKTSPGNIGAEPVTTAVSDSITVDSLGLYSSPYQGDLWPTHKSYSWPSPVQQEQNDSSLVGLIGKLGSLPPRRILTHRGVAFYDVLWKVNVNTATKLQNPSIEGCVYVDTIWEEAN